MKQHITKKQWDELNFKNKCKLDKIFPLDNINEIKGSWYNPLTFGQLVEFLGDDLNKIKFSDDISDNRVYLFTEIKAPIFFRDRQILDALWGAVKYKLK